MTERREIAVQGIVQGVGFRPFVYGLAQKHHLAGFVRNDNAGVMIELEGEPRALDSFVQSLGEAPPPLSDEVVERTRNAYIGAYEQLTGRKFRTD